MKPDLEFLENSAAILKLAKQSFFELFDSLCEGAIAIDRSSRIVWISDKYVALLGLASRLDALGKPIREVIPNTLMPEVVETGRPILLDIMGFGERSFVVTRIPLKDETGAVTGAIGFVLYDSPQYLKPLVSKFSELQNRLADAQKALAECRRPKYTFSSFIGGSPACLEVKRQARRAAQLDTTVLLLGETGTGKELLAHAIHAASARNNKPFIGVNVAAVPDGLLEAEFFGAAPGAYTGADRKGRDGRFKLADGGTLFLDEVGDMPLSVQAKLLRALQEQEIEPLGSDKVIKVDVRVIAATSRDLRRLVAEGRFRSDLYYRLNVLPITLPPLRHRLEDLEPLCDAILEKIAGRAGVPVPELDPSVYSVLARYDWPGNVRELANVLERAMMLADRSRLTAEDFAAILPQDTRPVTVPSAPNARPLAKALAEVERSAIQSALESARGNKVRAARLLGISRATLYEKLAQHQLLSNDRS